MISRNPLLSLLILLVTLPAAATAQTRLPEIFPDSITIDDNAWNLVRSHSNHYTLVRQKDGYTLFENASSYSNGRRQRQSVERTERTDIAASAIRGLIRAVNDSGFSMLRITDLGVDSGWIVQHGDRLFTYIKRKHDNWTQRQIAFTKKQLTDYSNYAPAARRAILQEGYYVIAKDYAVNFTLRFYYPDGDTTSLSASENYLGLPWTVGGRNSFNPAIPHRIASMLSAGGIDAQKFGDTNPLALLARQVFDDKCDPQLPALAVLEYAGYINDLRADFNYLGGAEAPLEWLEFKNHWPQTFRFTLHHPSLHPGIQLLFYSTNQGYTLYPIDSLRRSLPILAGRIQNLKFLMDYLDENPARRINLFFFDNRAVTLKHINDFNTDSSHWKMHDFWVKSMDMYKDDRIQPSFNIEESIETSKQVNCGCNFRLDNAWLRQSMLFELRDEFNQSSTWLLLPNNTLVLWHFQAETVYKYSYRELGTRGRGVQYPCKKLDGNGNLLR